MKYAFGDSFRWFLGIVEDVMDPLMVGRVKIRVINEQDTDEVSTDELLWAYPMNPVQSASMASQNVEGARVNPGPTAVGWSPTGIEVGSYAFGFFFDGAEGNVPIMIGTYPKIPGATSGNVKGGAEGLMNHDVSMLAREQQTLEKVQDGGDLVTEPKSAYGAKYPNNKTFTTKAGHAIEIDDTTGAERIHIYHKSGSYEEINKDGRWVRKVVDDDYEIVMKDKKVYVKGDVTIEVDGNAVIDVAKNVDLTVGENVTADVGGSVSWQVGGSWTLNAASVKTTTGSWDLNQG